MPVQSFGNYDTTSKGSFAASLVTRKGPAKRQDSVTPPIPSAFPPKPQQNFAPPPVRRVPSDSSSNPGSARKTPPVPRREEIEQEEEAGEWADVLYDYNSGVSMTSVSDMPRFLMIMSRNRQILSSRRDSGFLLSRSRRQTGTFIPIKHRLAINRVCRWKGQFNGKEGLFPSSYVRIL